MGIEQTRGVGIVLLEAPKMVSLLKRGTRMQITGAEILQQDSELPSGQDCVSFSL